jgi:ribosomal protein L32E
MPGKRVQFDDETLAAIDAVARRKSKSFQELADEAFKDLLKKYRQPVGLKAALKESVGGKGKS